MHIDKLSLYIVAMNEERRIGKALESVKGLVDEIVVVDSGSTDRTEEIARSYGARFIFHEWESIGHQVSFAEKQCSHRWVLRLDADEVIPPDLYKEIQEARQVGIAEGYYFKSGEIYPGYKKPNPFVKHYTLIRLYTRDAFEMSGKIGLDDVVPLKQDIITSKFSNFLHHYSYLSIHKMVEKRNIATDRQVERALIEGKHYSPWRMVGVMSLNFLKTFFIDRFFLYGFWGFIHAINIGFMRFMKMSKFYEHEQLKKHGYPN